MLAAGTLDDFVGRIVYDNRLDSYKSFFDHPWAKRLSEFTKGTRLDGAACDLCLDWKSAALTSRMPWLHVTSLSDFHDGYTSGGPSVALKLLDALANRIPKEMASNLSRNRQRELQAIILRLKKDVDAVLGDTPALDPKKVWGNYLSIEEFGLSLWSSQRLCYAAVYYGYEDFLRRIVSEFGFAKKTHMSTKDVAKGFEKIVGPAIAFACIFGPEITLARNVRNAIVHNGGRVTDEIMKSPVSFRTDGGRVQIMPEDTNALFHLLKERITVIADKILKPQEPTP
jgi:hypothetical protein